MDLWSLSTESRKILRENLKRESRGFSDFNYTRNRILWATRDNPSVRGIPKPKDEIKKNKGKKRGSYNKKK